MKRFWLLAFAFWFVFGLRLLYTHALAPDLSPLELRIPFAELPMDLMGGGWEGHNILMDPEIVRAVGLSDYVQREYRNGDRSFLLFVSYVSGGFPRAVHRPQNDTPTQSWRQESRRTLTIPCVEISRPLRFRDYVWSNVQGERTYTLSSFYYNGKFDPEELHLRLERSGVRYFATITLSGPVVGDVNETRHILEEALTHLLPPLLRHFP